jgi:hypothetical protein
MYACVRTFIQIHMLTYTCIYIYMHAHTQACMHTFTLAAVYVQYMSKHTHDVNPSYLQNTLSHEAIATSHPHSHMQTLYTEHEQAHMHSNAGTAVTQSHHHRTRNVAAAGHHTYDHARTYGGKNHAPWRLFPHKLPTRRGAGHAEAGTAPCTPPCGRGVLQRRLLACARGHGDADGERAGDVEECADVHGQCGQGAAEGPGEGACVYLCLCIYVCMYIYTHTNTLKNVQT